MTPESSSWSRCTVVNLDHSEQKVEAYFNPKEISIQKNVPWTEHNGNKGDLPTLEFTNAGPMVMTFELFFDCYEEKRDVFEAYVEKLQSFTLVPLNSRGQKRHPPRVMLVWGNKRFVSFDGVITSLATKYTMFLPDGTPVRATCTLTVKQAPRPKRAVPPPPEPRWGAPFPRGLGEEVAGELRRGQTGRGRGSPGDLLE